MYSAYEVIWYMHAVHILDLFLMCLFQALVFSKVCNDTSHLLAFDARGILFFSSYSLPLLMECTLQMFSIFRAQMVGIGNKVCQNQNVDQLEEIVFFQQNVVTPSISPPSVIPPCPPSYKTTLCGLWEDTTAPTSFPAVLIGILSVKVEVQPKTN